MTWKLIKFFAAFAIAMWAGIAMVVLLLSMGCTFSPVRIEGLPEECNVAYSTMRLVNGKGVDKSLAVVPMNKCLAVISRDRCKDEIFGKGNPVDYNDLKKYRDYSECLKEMK